MSHSSYKSIVEALLFASEKPLSPAEILKILYAVEDPQGLQEISDASLSPEDQLAHKQQREEGKCSKFDILQILQELKIEYESRLEGGFYLSEVNNGFQLRSSPQFSNYIQALFKTAPTKLSQAALETLAIIAYRQPLIRAEIDEIRGVDSGGVLKTLLERDLVKVIGKREEAGKPLLYGTTGTFLEVFGLSNLQSLPPLKDLRQIEEESSAGRSNEGFILPLPADLFEEEKKEAFLQDERIQTSFAALEQEEEEALKELEEKLKTLEQVEKEVIQQIFPAQEPPTETV